MGFLGFFESGLHQEGQEARRDSPFWLLGLPEEARRTSWSITRASWASSRKQIGRGLLVDGQEARTRSASSSKAGQFHVFAVKNRQEAWENAGKCAQYDLLPTGRRSLVRWSQSTRRNHLYGSTGYVILRSVGDRSLADRRALGERSVKWS